MVAFEDRHQLRVKIVTVYMSYVYPDILAVRVRGTNALSLLSGRSLCR